MLLNGTNIEETTETCTFDDYLKNKKSTSDDDLWCKI